MRVSGEETSNCERAEWEICSTNGWSAAQFFFSFSVIEVPDADGESHGI